MSLKDKFPPGDVMFTINSIIKYMWEYVAVMLYMRDK